MTWVRTITGFAEIIERTPAVLSEDEAAVALGELLRDDPAYDNDLAFTELVEELLAFTADDSIPYLVTLIDEIYDWADDNRVWIEPIPAPVAATTGGAP